MTETRKRPDWTLWLNLPKLKVWQAVALSLDIDPDSMKPSPHGWMSGPDGALSFMPASFADDAQATEFDKRRRIAAAQLAGRENADRAEGALRPFLDLAAGLGWPIPDALRLPMAEVSEPLLALLPSATKPVPMEAAREVATEPVAGVVQATVTPAAVQRAAVQEAVIIASLRAATYDPKSLPKNEPGKPGVKAEIRAAVGGDGMWSGSTVFDKAWERLMRQRDIAYRA